MGAALLRHYLDEGWLLRVQESRKLVVTPRGRDRFITLVGVDDAFFSGSGTSETVRASVPQGR